MTTLTTLFLATLTATPTVELSGWTIAAATIAVLLTVAGIEIGIAWLLRADHETERILRDRE